MGASCQAKLDALAAAVHFANVTRIDGAVNILTPTTTILVMTYLLSQHICYYNI